MAAVFLVSAVTGCSGRPEVHTDVVGCGLRADTVMAVNRELNVILLPAILEDEVVQMKLDTGAEVSALFPGTIADFGLREDNRTLRELDGAGGSVRAGSVVASRFAIGSLPPHPTAFSVGVRDLLPGRFPPVAGLIGTDLLWRHELELDAPNLRATLYSLDTCPAFVPWPMAKGVALTRTPSGLSFVVLDIDGHAVRALLDTGASTTTMTRRLAEALGVSSEALAADPGFVRFGLRDSRIELRQHRFDQITLGPVTWRDVPVGVADLHLPGVDMLLGADLLAQQRIWISPTRSMLWLG